MFAIGHWAHGEAPISDKQEGDRPQLELSVVKTDFLRHPTNISLIGGVRLISSDPRILEPSKVVVNITFSGHLN